MSGKYTLSSFVADASEAANSDDDDDDEDEGLSLNDLNDFYAEDETGESFDDEELRLANTPYDQRNKLPVTDDFVGIKLPVDDTKPYDVEENDTDDVNI